MPPPPLPLRHAMATRCTAPSQAIATVNNRYEQLSKDPNSLANLDQDLPNYAQHMVPIHSLPQEWLWCETWCDDESKPKAKTIDLCNNPETKTPKLVRARRSRNIAHHAVAPTLRQRQPLAHAGALSSGRSRGEVVVRAQCSSALRTQRSGHDSWSSEGPPTVQSLVALRRSTPSGSSPNGRTTMTLSARSRSE